MKKYTLTIQRDYCSDWTIPDAIRELIQNSLDTPASFQYEIGGDYITLTNTNTQLATNTLLLGNTTKRNDPNSVGGKGEGYKIAMLILTREGVKVDVYNGNKHWIPHLEWDHNYEAEMLSVHEYDLANNQNLTFHIQGLSQEDIETVIENCLYLQDKDSLGNFSTAKCGSRVFWEKSGKVYVGGLFVCNTDLSYTYDFAPSKLPLNRDRKQVDSWNLRGETARVLQEVADATKILELAKKEAEDVNHFQYSWRAKHEDAATLAYEDFKEKYGEESVVAENYDEMIRLQKEGYVNVVVVDKEAYRELIVSSDEYKEYFNSIEIEAVEDKSPIELLEDLLAEIDLFGAEDKFEKLLDIFKERGVEWVR